MPCDRGLRPGRDSAVARSSLVYSGQIDEKGKDYDLGYRWTTSEGEIVLGQGTASIQVKWNREKGLTATVEVTGLPKDCPSMASETVYQDSPPEAVRLGVLYSFETEVSEEKLKEFAEELARNPNSQGYIIIGSKPETKPSEFVAREIKLKEVLAKLMGRSYDRSRLTFARWYGKVDLVELWRVPPGAENPKCEQCNPKGCPAIMVVGPAGIIQPGDVATFKVQIDDQQRFGNLQYEWTVSGGEFLNGQGTIEIEVRAKNTWPVQMNASVHVAGLPQDCLDTAGDKVEFMLGPHPLLIDEFGRLTNNAIKPRLKKFFVELANNPNNQGYIIVYGTENEMAARERLIVKSVNFRNFDRSRITIVRGGTHLSGKVYTKLYRVPPGAENPAP